MPRNASIIGLLGCRVRFEDITLVAALAMAASLASTSPADEYYLDYGFRTIDNSAGGGALDGYLSQEFWADTDMRWLGTQLRLVLDQGAIFQRAVNGTHFTAESNHDVLAAVVDPAIAFDTRIGVNGQAPDLVIGGASNLGGGSAITFSDTILDVAFAGGPGKVLSGSFNFGTMTLRDDAEGRGAILLSSVGISDIETVPIPGSYGYFAHLFDVHQGIISLTGEPIPLYGRNLPPGEQRLLTPDFRVFDPRTGVPPDPMEPIAIRFDPQTLLPILDADIIVLPAITAGLDAFVPFLPDFLELSGMELEDVTLFAATSGEVFLPLTLISNDAVTRLVLSGNWTVRGENVVFSPGSAIPEPASFAILVLAVGSASVGRRFLRKRLMCGRNGHV